MDDIDLFEQQKSRRLQQSIIYSYVNGLMGEKEALRLLGIEPYELGWMVRDWRLEQSKELPSSRRGQ